MHIIETYDDYLAHYGVKGMKWGRRKKDDGSKMSRSENKAAAKSERNAETKRRLENSSGTMRTRKLKVSSAIVGKTLATAVLAETGTLAVSNNRVTRSLTPIVNQAVGVYNINLGLTAVKDIVSVVRYRQ